MSNNREENKIKFALFQTKGAKCCNCGSLDRLKLRLIVPEAIGGKWEENNVTLLCRACEMALDAMTGTSKNSKSRSINIWVSTSFYKRIQDSLKNKKGFSSIGALARYLMQKYLEDPARFDDLEQYQVLGADNKINIWVDADIYTQFKELVSKRGSTVKDSIISLIAIYNSEAEVMLN